MRPVLAVEVVKFQGSVNLPTVCGGEVMDWRVVAVTACLALSLPGATSARIADRDLEFIVARNEATRAQLASVRYAFAEGAYAYRSPGGRGRVAEGQYKGRHPMAMRQGTVLADGDYRAWEVETLIPGTDGVDDLHTRTFAVRNDRYFALSNGVITDGGFASFSDVYVYPHSTRTRDGQRVGLLEEERYTADVLDYAFLSDRLGRTLREEVEASLLTERSGAVELEVLQDLDGNVGEYRIHLMDGDGKPDVSRITYTLDPQAGFLIKRKETYDTNGNLVAQRRVTNMPLGETGLHFPAEVIELTFEMQDSPDGPLPMPVTETRTVARDVELLRSLEPEKFGLGSLGVDDEDLVTVFDGVRNGHPTRMDAKTADDLQQPGKEQAPRERIAPAAPEHRRVVGPSLTTRPSASGGLVDRMWSLFSWAFGWLSLEF